MTKQYTIVNEIVKETEKAILVSADGEVWLPKSQVEVIDIDGWPIVIALPGWLWNEKRSWLSLRTTAEQIYEATGVICR